MMQPAFGHPVRPVVGCRLVIIGREKDTKTTTTPPRPVTRGKRRQVWSLSPRSRRRSTELAYSYYAIPAVGAEKTDRSRGLAMRAMGFRSGVVRFGEILSALARGKVHQCSIAASRTSPRPRWRGSRRGRVGGDRARAGVLFCKPPAWLLVGLGHSGTNPVLLWFACSLHWQVHVNRKARAHLFATLAILSRTHDSRWTKPAEGGGNWLSTCEHGHMSMHGIGRVTEIKTVPSNFWPTLAYVVLDNHPIACHRFRVFKSSSDERKTRLS